VNPSRLVFDVQGTHSFNATPVPHEANR